MSPSLPDCGVKYLSKIYSDEWLLANNLAVYDANSASKQQHQLPPPFPTLRAPKYHQLVGNTPLIDLSHLILSPNCEGVQLLAKVEFFNPSFSIKDRIARNIIEKAEMDGTLRKGMTIVAASSGNTGAAVAMLASCKGYRCIVTTSPKCSKEKMDVIRAYGATLLVSKANCKEGDSGHYMEIATSLCLKDPAQYFDVNQYNNLDNPDGHFRTLGPEIWEQTNGTVTHFVAAGSTGGTISGVSKYLKSKNPQIQTVLADPMGSIFTNHFYNTPLEAAEKRHKFLVEGVGKGSIPGAMDFKVIDSVVQVSDKEAFDMCYSLCKHDGIFAGGSSGLNVFAALQLASSLTKPCTIVTVLPDIGIKYLSKVYNAEWLEANGLGDCLVCLEKGL